MAGDRLVGVIGGMGPAATIDFMARVVEHTSSVRDQDHVRMLVDQNPRVPSRQLAMSSAGESPGPMLAEMAKRLEGCGADFLVMPCNAAHAWKADIVSVTSIPFISIIAESVSTTAECTKDDGAIGLLTTRGCFAAGLYQRALADANREAILQSPEELGETMALIDSIKAGDKSEAVVAGLRRLANLLVSRGAETVIAACTELPLVLDQSMLSVPLVASTDVLAKKAVALALSTEPLPKQ